MPVCHPRRDPSALRRFGTDFSHVEWTGPDEDDKPASVITQSEKIRDGAGFSPNAIHRVA